MFLAAGTEDVSPGGHAASRGARGVQVGVGRVSLSLLLSVIQGAHAGLIRSYNVFYFRFYIIRLLERSYFCFFLWKGLIKVLFLVINEIKNSLPATCHTNSSV